MTTTMRRRIAAHRQARMMIILSSVRFHSLGDWQACDPPLLSASGIGELLVFPVVAEVSEPGC